MGAGASADNAAGVESLVRDRLALSLMPQDISAGLFGGRHENEAVEDRRGGGEGGGVNNPFDQLPQMRRLPNGGGLVLLPRGLLSEYILENERRRDSGSRGSRDNRGNRILEDDNDTTSNNDRGDDDTDRSDSDIFSRNHRRPRRRRRLHGSVFHLQDEDEGHEAESKMQHIREDGEANEVLYYCHSCQASFYAPAPQNDSSVTNPTPSLASDSADAGISQGGESKVEHTSADGEEETKSGDESSHSTGNGNASLTPPRSSRHDTPMRVSETNIEGANASAVAASPGSATSANFSAPRQPTDGAQQHNVRCPTCGDAFVELARMPNHRSRRRSRSLLRQRQRQAQQSEAMHVQALLSALRASIVNQLEEAELRMALRQSMEDYKPKMNPGCKQSIEDLVEMEIISPKTSDTEPSIVKSGETSSTTLDELPEPSCPICTEDYVVGETIVKSLPQCKHGFHSACIKKWFNVNNTCPICRAVLPAKCEACQENQRFAQELADSHNGRRTSRANETTTGTGLQSSDSSSGTPAAEASAVAEAAVAQAVAAAAARTSSSAEAIEVPS